MQVSDTGCERQLTHSRRGFGVSDFGASRAGFWFSDLVGKECQVMSIEENKQLVVRWRDELWNKRNVNVLDDLCAPDYVGHIAGVPEPVHGREAFKQLAASYLAASDTR